MGAKHETICGTDLGQLAVTCERSTLSKTELASANKCPDMYTNKHDTKRYVPIIARQLFLYVVFVSTVLLEGVSAFCSTFFSAVGGLSRRKALRSHAVVCGQRAAQVYPTHSSH
jgi:hypothetical protein